jgi:hypothetical protein
MKIIHRRIFAGAILISIGLIACKKEPALLNDASLLLPMNDPWKTYTIDSSSHFSNKNDFVPFNSDSLHFVAVFDHSAIYASKQASNQSDINKLYGFSDCSTIHHENSARFGWNWHNNSLRIYAYVYKDGIRTSKEMTSLSLEKENEFKILKKDGKYIFTVNQAHHTVIPAGCHTQVQGYRLYPFFGGDEKAPHQVTIRIKDFNL